MANQRIVITEDLNEQVTKGMIFVQGLHGMPKDPYWEHRKPEDFYWEEGSTAEEKKFIFKDWVWGKGINYADILPDADAPAEEAKAPTPVKPLVESIQLTKEDEEERALQVLGIDKDTFKFLKNNNPEIKKLKNLALINHHKSEIERLEKENSAL